MLTGQRALEAMGSTYKLATATLSALCATVSGCVSFSYVDEQNVRHVVGFMRASIPAAAADGSPAPSVIKIDGVGLLVSSHAEIGSEVAFGYFSQALIALPDNACIDLAAPGPCTERATTTREASKSSQDAP